MSSPIRPLAGPYFVVGHDNTNGRPLLDIVKAATEGGVNIIQLREKALEAGPLLEETRQISKYLQKVLNETGTRPIFLIDDRVDVALFARNQGLLVDGVHVGQTDLPVLAVRELLGPDAIIGLSCRNVGVIEQAGKAQDQGQRPIDYLGMGPVHTTQSKPGIPDGMGFSQWEVLRETAKEALPGVPCFGIGGITPDDAGPLKEVGADGYCCITYISHAQDTLEAATQFSSAW
jgi:thiamine-phosphate diphosphorylase